MSEENNEVTVQDNTEEIISPVVVDQFEFYGISDFFHLYRIPDSDSKILEILSNFNLGTNYINTATGVTILACAEELEIDGVNILEKIR